MNQEEPSLRPEIPEDLDGVNALLELARAFMPSFNLPQLVSAPPLASQSASAETRVRQVEARYQTLVEQIPAVTFMASFENGLSEIYVSPHIEQMLGYTAKEWIEDPILWYQRLHPDDKERWNKEFSRTVSWAEPFKSDYRFLAKDGRVVWIHGEAKIVRDESGRPCFIQGIGYDITEQKQAHEVLQNSEKKFKGLLEFAPDAILIVDQDGTIALVNAQAEKLFGYKREELLGKRIDTLVPARFRDRHPDHRQGFFQNPRTRAMGANLDLFGQRKDGTEFPVEISLSPLETEEGMLAMAAVRDITARKMAESALNAAKEEAERASNAKSEFLSRMSHELRTPLNAILGFGQLLERQDATPVQRSRITQITSAGRHLLKLIDEVLDISRIEAGKLQLSLEPVSVASVVEEATDLIGPLAAERDILLSTPSLPEAGVFVMADYQRLKQVLLNLLSNAVKFTPLKGSVTLSCSESRKNTVRIMVSDTGAGIESDKLARLFTPFDRLGAEQSKVEGTGLGLALSNRLIEAMGGTIGVESTVGQGSSFWVDLPRTQSPQKRSSGERKKRPRNLPEGKRVILYIEDNVSNIALLREILSEQSDIELISAMQGRIGLDLARKYLPSLILLDVHLPDLPGEEVLAKLRSMHDTRGIPVIVTSADITPRRIENFLAQGANAYLTKPLDIAEFSRVVDETIDLADKHR